jgi:hypothetical protein
MAAERPVDEDGRTAPARPAVPEEPAPAAAPLCAFALCPICAALTAFGDARPDLVEHMLVASREVLLAVRALVDARLEGTERSGPARRVERLTIS